MRQTHVAGEKLFVDFAGRKVPVIYPSTGEIRESHIFVAALGASNFIYVEACWSEGAADWIACHVRALASIGGVPKLLVCDNTKAGVISACRYEPGLNRSYVDFAVHYGTSILPTRVRRRARRSTPPRRASSVIQACQAVISGPSDHRLDRPRPVSRPETKQEHLRSDGGRL